MDSVRKNRPKTWNSHRRGKTPSYVYRTLSKISGSSVSDKEWVNVYGVVIDFRHTKKSKGTDFFCVLRITDPSYDQNDGVKVRLFHSDPNQLPKVNEFDIIRLHRVRIDKYIEQVALIGTKSWSWVVWSCKTSDPIEKGISGSETYTVTDTDRKHVEDLRKWVKEQNSDDKNLDGIASDENKEICNVHSGSFFNWICQIVAIAVTREDTAILKVWDGTLPKHKIDPSPALDEVKEFATLPDLPDIEPYVVQVTIYDNHVKSLNERQIKAGSYVRICNLHASTKWKHQNDDESNIAAELFLHEGEMFDRGIIPVDQDQEEVSRMIERQKRILEERKKISQESQASTQESQAPAPSGKRPHSLSPEILTPTNSKKQKIVRDVSPSDDGYITPPQTMEGSSQDTSPIPLGIVVEKLATRPPGSQDTLQMLMEMENQGQTFTQPGSNATGSVDSCDVSSQESTASTVRCHQESHTVVFGDSSPLNVTPIRDVIKSDVPVRTSKLFRIRAKVQRCSDPGCLVFHHCPVTGINIAAKNDGGNLEIPKDLHQWLTKWRESSGLDQKGSPPDGDNDLFSDNFEKSSEDEDINTQWPVPGLADQIKMASYRDESDHSYWESMTCRSHVIRKRKCQNRKFTILYDSKGVESLEDLSANYDRVVRVLSKEELTSSSLPPVAYQAGIYYYCSPACVSSVAIPPLSEESKCFSPKPTQALSSPLLIHRFHILLKFGDDSDHLEATLSGKSAVSFFNGVTPGKYLTDPRCPAELRSELQRLLGENDSIQTGEAPFVEAVIEKKSRRAVREGDPPVIVYDVINTRLRQW